MRRFASLPLACYAVMLAYSCYGAAVVGHWPYHANPDPKELPLRPLLHFVAIVMFTGGSSLFLLPMGYAVWRLVIRLKHCSPPNHRTWLLLYAAGGFLWILDFTAGFGRMPWHSIVSWILD